jgi:uncharacterized protein (DUF302 family)
LGLAAFVLAVRLRRTGAAEPDFFVADLIPRWVSKSTCARESLMRHVLLIAAGLVAAVASVTAQSPERVDRASARNFQTTVKQLETALQSRGFMIVARADHQNMLRMVGANTKGALTIEFGKPDMMKMQLPAHPEIGLEMPMRIYVWERADGKAIVSYRRPSAGFAAYGPDLKTMGDMMDRMFDEIAADATR